MSGSMSDTLSQALMSPGVDALIGMAQGFGQAAMPSRLPTPFASALGQGLGGTLSGLQSSQQLQKADMSNQFMRNQYNMMQGMMQPGGAGPNAPMGAPSVYSGGASGSGSLIDPNYAARMAQIMASNPETAKAAGPWLDMYRGFMPSGGGTMLTPLGVAPVPGALLSEQAKAAATSSGTKGGEAPYVPPSSFKIQVPDSAGRPPGSPGYVPTLQDTYMTAPQANAAATTPMASPPGLSQSIPRGIRNNNPLNLEYRPNQPGVAGTDGRFGVYPTMDHGVASAVNQLQQYGQSGINTIGGIVQKWAPPGENDSAKYAQNVAMLMGTKTNAPLTMNDPQTMTRLVSAMGQVENGQMVDPGAVTRGVAMALNGGSPSAQVAGPGAPSAPGATSAPPASGTAAPVPPGSSPPAVSAMPSALIPPRVVGMAGSPALTPQQDADLKVSTANRMPADLRVGGERVSFDVNGQPIGVIKNPEHIVVGNADGTSTLGHLEPAPPNAPPGTPGTFVPVAKLDAQGNAIPGEIGKAVPPDVQQGRTELVKEFFGKDTDSYVAAKNTQGWLAQIDHAADAMNSANGIYNTGPYATARIGLMQGVNDVSRTLGLRTPFDEKTLSAPEELRKATTTAGFELSSHYEGHARQAASTIENATSAVPGMSNSPQGVQLVASGIREGAQSAIDSHEYRQARFQGQDPYNINPAAAGQRAGAGLETAETDFYKKFTPEMYANRAISTVQPPSIAANSLADFNAKTQQYLPGTRVIIQGQKNADGTPVIKIVPERAGAPPIPSYIQQRFMAPPVAQGTGGGG